MNNSNFKWPTRKKAFDFADWACAFNLTQLKSLYLYSTS